jgi:hypothetical protein
MRRLRWIGRCRRHAHLAPVVVLNFARNRRTNRFEIRNFTICLTGGPFQPLTIILSASSPADDRCFTCGLGGGCGPRAFRPNQVLAYIGRYRSLVRSHQNFPRISRALHERIAAFGPVADLPVQHMCRTVFSVLPQSSDRDLSNIHMKSPNTQIPRRFAVIFFWILEQSGHTYFDR